MLLLSHTLKGLGSKTLSEFPASIVLHIAHFKNRLADLNQRANGKRGLSQIEIHIEIIATTKVRLRRLSSEGADHLRISQAHLHTRIRLPIRQAQPCGVTPAVTTNPRIHIQIKLIDRHMHSLGRTIHQKLDSANSNRSGSRQLSRKIMLFHVHT